ncbi:TonB-dependent receptor plug domain-containing protein [Paludibaculum fermentans]|uniref:TonB-dependent receptor plug domain-containing protein n=1 Tax=Paludibaculum fermentans TaxID=1473598 RepID=A0A7S7NML3_PALFE|nr:TonB-dependent receptor plug domain-containing protein [Paludibaculum fermentans]QOY86371.1 TonB-dependent receptor plug domain-containing protein [Paludibaculum fermentans]
MFPGTLVRVLTFFLLLAAARGQTPVRGQVRDAQGGEPLARVQCALHCGERVAVQRSGTDGRFEFAEGAGLGCSVTLTLVGYRPLRLEIDGTAELDLALTPDSLARRDSVDVHAGPFEVTQSASASERTLTGAEMKNLAGVLVDDPLRAVQSLPGVASSNDFIAQFSVRGSAFDRVGIFLDGVLLHSPFHTVQSQEETGSLSMLQADLVEELTLHAGAPPVEYQDRSASALDIRLREGSREGPAVRINVGVASTAVILEGPLGSDRRGSWLVSVRRSYLQYLLRRTSAADSLAFGFFDTQGKLSYDLSRRNALTLGFMDGLSDLDRSHVRATLGVNAIMDGTYHVSALNLGWRYTPSSDLQVTNRLAWIRERSDNRNNLELPLAAQGYGEWVWNPALVWSWKPKAPLQAGGSFRRLHDDGFSARYNFNPLAVRRRDNWRGTGLRAGGFVQQDWIAGPLTLTAGVRVDGYSEAGPTALSPHGSALLRVGPATRLQLAWSQAVQYPALLPLRIENMGNRFLLPERANHTVAAVEQALGERTRLRAEFFYRADRDLITQPLLDPRVLPDGQIFIPPASPQYLNSERGTARGFEVFLQRRTANRLSGWVSYGYVKTAMRDGVTGASYPADYEQRHTMNAYSSYRLRPSLNLSARYSYGSNFPVPGFFRQTDPATYVLNSVRNAVRLPEYHRADLRINKSFQWRSWRSVLFVEVANLTNHENVTFDSFNGFNSRTGQASPTFLKLFPIVPAAGLMLEWDARLRRK